MMPTPDERLAAILAIARAALHGYSASMPIAVQADLHAIEQLAEGANWPPDCFLCGKPMTAQHDRLSVAQHIAQNPNVVVTGHA